MWKRLEYFTRSWGNHPDQYPTKPGGNGRQLCLAWYIIRLGTSSGLYQAKSGYHGAKEITSTIMDPIENINWNVLVWNTSTSPKLKLFLWKILRGALPLGEQLASRGIRSQAQCIRSGEPKSAAQVWNLAPLKESINSHYSGCRNGTQSFKIAYMPTSDWDCNR